MSGPRVLVAGIGNLFLGDDGFGCEVARQLASRPQHANVKVRDFGTRGVDLAYEVASGWSAVIFVDAAQRGGDPGTLYVLDPATPDRPSPMDGHTLRLHQVLPTAKQLGELPQNLRLVACEPASVEGPDAGVGLSPAVSAAVAPAVTLVESLVAQWARP